MEGGDGAGSYPFDIGEKGEAGVEEIDPSPLFAGIMNDIASGKSRERIARAFHNSVASLISETLTRLSERTGVGEAVVSGGVFQNRLLCELLEERSRNAPWKLYGHLLVPPNDGGVSFGQAAVAAAILSEAGNRGEKE